MSFACRRAAARNALATILAALSIAPGSALAEGGQNLILPLVTAIAVASAATNVPRQVATIEPGGRPLLSLIPSRVQIQDGYEIDVNDYIGLRDPVELVNVDRVASFDVLRRPRHGWRAAFAYDTESRGPLGGSADVLRFIAEYRF